LKLRPSLRPPYTKVSCWTRPRRQAINDLAGNSATTTSIDVTICAAPFGASATASWRDANAGAIGGAVIGITGIGVTGTPRDARDAKCAARTRSADKRAQVERLSGVDDKSAAT